MLSERELMAARELAMLDQVEAALLEMLNETHLARERRAINVRLQRLERIRRLWRQPNRSNAYE